MNNSQNFDENQEIDPDVIASHLREKIEAFFDFEQLDEDLKSEEKERVLINNLLPAPDRG